MACDTTITPDTGMYPSIFLDEDSLRWSSKHCANRTHRLRSSLKITHGKGKEFKKLPPITPEVVNDGQ